MPILILSPHHSPSTSLPVSITCSLDVLTLTLVRSNLQVVSIFISLMVKDLEHLKEYLLAICISPFENHLFISLDCLLIGRLWFCVFKFCSSLNILDINPHLRFFSSSQLLLLFLPALSLALLELLNFMESYLLSADTVSFDTGIVFQKLLPKPRTWLYFHVSFSSFSISSFKVRSFGFSFIVYTILIFILLGNQSAEAKRSISRYQCLLHFKIFVSVPCLTFHLLVV